MSRVPVGFCCRAVALESPFQARATNNAEFGVLLSQVPAFVYSTSHIPEERRGTTYGGMMHVTDWLPTIATAAGIELNGA